jgi:hypothetical protein
MPLRIPSLGIALWCLGGSGVRYSGSRKEEKMGVGRIDLPAANRLLGTDRSPEASRQVVEQVSDQNPMRSIPTPSISPPKRLPIRTIG